MLRCEFPRTRERSFRFVPLPSVQRVATEPNRSDRGMYVASPAGAQWSEYTLSIVIPARTHKNFANDRAGTIFYKPGTEAAEEPTCSSHPNYFFRQRAS